MPAPERYAGAVPEMRAIWEPRGYFKAQLRIWEAQSEARHELYGEPTTEQLGEIKGALILGPEDIERLNIAKGHETNKLLRTVQARLSPEAGNFIHRGNTSFDVLDTSLAMQTIESLSLVRTDFSALHDSLKELALKHRETLQVGRTHGQHAIPQTFGRQVVGWYTEVGRGLERIDRAKEVIAVGKISGEIGTSVYIPPELEERTLQKLGLKPDEAPTQVISRDRHAEIMGLLAVNAGTLARIAVNIRLLAQTDVGEAREPFDEATQQGSSAMPHKRNPELTERIVGLNRIVRNQPQAELDAMLLWFERDISNSATERYTFPDMFETILYMSRLTREVVDGLVVNDARMLENLNRTNGAIYSPRLLNELLATGQFSRTDAYELVKRLAHQAIDEERPLFDLAIGNEHIVAALGAEAVANLFNPDFYLQNIDVAYRRAGLIE